MPEVSRKCDFHMLEDLENRTPKRETPTPVKSNYSSVGCSATILKKECILETSIEIDGYLVISMLFLIHLILAFYRSL